MPFHKSCQLCLQGLCDPVVSAAGGSVRSVKVARHRGPHGKLLSAGFGFVECSSEQCARAALKRLQAGPFSPSSACAAQPLLLEAQKVHRDWGLLRPISRQKSMMLC